MTISVLIVDDEPLVRAGLRAILEDEPDLSVVGEAGDGDEVLGAVDALHPDVVLMDVRMPHIDGLRATELLVARPGAPRILILTTFDSDDHVYDALRLGADGFVVKRAEPAELVRAIRTVAGGEALLYPVSIRRLAAARMPRDNPAIASLSEREQDVLRLLARGGTNSEIAAELFVGVETVKSHVAGILMKLGARDRTQAVIVAYESGFIRPQ